MTTRNLDALFEPAAIALIGASNRPGTVGQVLARNLMESGFAGPVMCVNPHETAIRSAKAYASVSDLPMTPDLAVIATPPATVPGLVSELGAKGCRAVVVITAGLDTAQRQAMLDAARPHLLRIVGPNCLGFLSPGRGINASFAHLSPAAGRLALVAQSGAIATAALDWARARGVGFSQVVTLGDAADVDFGDMLDQLALDPQTDAILLYVESITDARKFMTAGRIAARTKPVMVIKAGRSTAGAKAAFSHTGALAGADAVYDAAFRRAGMVRVAELGELFDAVGTLASGLRVNGERLAILTNGGGAGVLAADALEAGGGRLAALSAATLAAIDQAAPANWSHGNPVDIIGDATAARYGAAMSALLAEPEADAILVMNCPTAVADSADAAEAVVAARAGRRRTPPVLACWLGADAVAEGRGKLAQAGIPTYDTPDAAVRAFMHLVEYRRNQALLMSAPGGAPVTADRKAARDLVARVLASGRRQLDAPETAALFRAYGLPVLDTHAAASPAEAARVAAQLAGPVAIKIRSPDISHKSDVGGVALAVAPAAVADVAQAMIDRVTAAAPTARIEGFLVQSMIERPKAFELLAGIAHDPTFGPVVLFGHGGVAVEIIADRIVGLPPLDRRLAGEMIERTRVAALLAGFRDRPPVDLDAICDVLVRLGQMALDLPQIRELDINPLLADASGVIALDGRVALSGPDARIARPAIRAYPDELIHQVEVDGRRLTVRPVRPDDADALAAMVAASAREDVRLRFGAGFRQLPAAWALRLSHIDYDREMALVAERTPGEIVGVARLAGDPEGETAEFALMVRSDVQQRGLGHRLLEDLIGYARDKGLAELWGQVASSNAPMLDLARALGFERTPTEDVAALRVTKALQATEAAPA